MSAMFSELPDLQQIWQRLRNIHRLWLVRVAARRALIGLTFLLLLFWLLALAEYLWGLPVVMRVTLLALLSVVVALGLVLFLRAWFGAVPFGRRAEDLESFAPELREQLLTAVEMADGGELERLGYSRWLYEQTVRVASQKLETLSLQPFWPRARLGHGLRWATVGLAVTLLLAWFFPTTAGRTLFALTNPQVELIRPEPFQWSVAQQTRPILQYEDVTLKATARGAKAPHTAELFWRYTDDGTWFSEVLASPTESAEAHFTHKLTAVPQTVQYRFEAKGRSSGTHSVTVTRRPELTHLEATCRPPTYTGIPEFVLPADEQRWIVPDGSAIRLTTQSDRELTSGHLAFSDSTRAALTVDGQSGTVTWRATDPQTVRVFVQDTAGFANYDPVPIDVEIIPDLSPQIAFVEPGRDRDIPDAMTVPAAIALLDDYGFSHLELIYNIVGQDGERPQQATTLNLPSRFGKEGVFEFNWSLVDARLFPGDRVMYRARVGDNDEPKAKWAETETFVLRLPTLDEIIAETERAQGERTDQVAEAVLKQRQVAEELREMARQLVGKEQVEWENRQQLEQAMATQQQMAKELEEWADEIEKEAEKLAQNRMTSLEMVQKMNEISRLMREVMTPEMQKALDRLREAMESLSPEEMRKALEEFQMSEEEIIAELDRALAQLKQLQLEQMMENMLRMAEQIAESQEGQNRLCESAADQQTLDSLAREEEALREELAELQKKAQELAEKSKEYEAPPQMEEFAQKAQQCTAAADMEQMARQMQSGKQSEASTSGKKAAQKLREMLAQMQQQMMGMRNQMAAEQMSKLRDLASRSLNLSDEQETMGDSTAAVSRQSLALRQLAAEQLSLSSGIAELLKDVKEQSEENLFLNPEIRRHLQESQQKSEQAVGALLERNGIGSQGLQYESMFSLNEAAKGLMESLDMQGQCQGSNSGQGKMHSGMQNLAQQQMNLNQMSQSAHNPFGLSVAEQQAAQRLSAQQQSIQRELQDLAGQYAQSRDRLGRLDEIAKSMEEVVEDLGAGEITDQTLERQRNIYNRMLDFQKSLQRQDFENRRQSRTGQDLAGRSPAPLQRRQPETDSESARWERFQHEWYPASFRALVKDYFEAVSRRTTESK